MNFTPPYVYSMRHDLETRKMIEAPNRATMATIFERRRLERQQLEWERKIKRMHDGGIHMPGRCPYCPANVYYD